MSSPSTEPGGPASGAPRPVHPGTQPALPPLELLGTTPSGREVRALRVPAAELLPVWHRLRAEHATSGLWPVLLGPEPSELCLALSGVDDYDDGAEVARASAMTVQDLAAARAERLEEGDEEDEDEEGEDAPPRRLDPQPAHVTVAETDGLVALVPAEHGWQVPAVLGWIGGCNYDVDVAEHVVTLRDWHERFGAELVSLSDDQVLELLVARPPTTPDEALAVAREHYAYCPDSVDQGVGSLTALAQEQSPSASWYFWWD